MPESNTIGDRMREARKALGLSQTAAAYRCGWESQSRVSMYERGQRSRRVAPRQFHAVFRQP